MQCQQPVGLTQRIAFPGIFIVIYSRNHCLASPNDPKTLVSKVVLFNSDIVSNIFEKLNSRAAGAIIAVLPHPLRALCLFQITTSLLIVSGEMLIICAIEKSHITYGVCALPKKDCAVSSKSSVAIYPKHSWIVYFFLGKMIVLIIDRSYLFILQSGGRHTEHCLYPRLTASSNEIGIMHLHIYRQPALLYLL